MAFLYSYEHVGVKDEFSNAVANLAPRDFIFQSMIGMKGIKNRLHNWQVDFDEPASDNAYKEGMKWSDVSGTETPTVILKNHCQKMAVAIEMTTESMMQAYWAEGDVFDRETEKKLRKLKRDREVAFLTNGAYVQADDKNNIPGKTGGFKSMVSSTDYGVTIEEDPLSGQVTYFVSATTTPTEEDIITALGALWVTGAHPEVIMVNNTMASVISAMQEDGGARLKVFDGETDKGINFEVNTITDPLGQTVKIIFNRYMPSNTVYIFNSEDWQKAVFRAPDTKETPEDGDYKKTVVVSDESLEHRNPWCSAVIEGKPAS